MKWYDNKISYRTLFELFVCPLIYAALCTLAIYLIAPN